ncbi:MAG: VanW family protein [Chloroflexota bacterium]|nr:VanW family protein [Chloroflexota bacterium]
MTSLALVGLTLAAAAVFVVCLVLGFRLAAGERVMAGVGVLGVSLGGLTREEAAARLEPVIASSLSRPVELRLADRVWRTSPGALGFDLQPADLAERAFRVGRSGSFLQQLNDQWQARRYATNLTVSAATNPTALDALLDQIAAQVDHAPQNAHLELDANGALVFGTDVTGLQLDKAQSRAAIVGSMANGSPSVDLVSRSLTPSVRTAQVEAAHQQLQKIFETGDSVQLKADGHTWSLGREDLLGLVAITPPGASGEPASVKLQDEPVQALVDRAAQQVDRPAQDARFAFSGGSLTLIRPSDQGQAVDRPAATALIASSILAGQHAIDLPIVPVPPAVASTDMPKLNAPDLIEEATTSFAGAIPQKRHNIQLAAQRLNGVVVPPGATFSFNKEVGPTTLEAGFDWGFGLATGTGGVHTVPAVAGGICQVATTLFQPVFWAGYQLEERYWHLYWIPAYTSRDFVGLDATVDADAGLDFKWVNPTSDAVLIQSSTDDEHVTFRLYGRKPAWSVHVDPPAVSNRVTADPSPVVQPEPTLAWGRTLLVESARDGFDVVINRQIVSPDGSTVRGLALKSVYQPSHTVTLVGTANAPAGASVPEALDQVRAAQQPAAPQQPAAAPAPATTYTTPNGPRTLAQIRDELGQAGWGGGSDQDALATYNRLAAGN